MTLPADVAPANSDGLKAVRAAAFMALTNAEPPLSFCVSYTGTMAELSTRLQTTEESRFRLSFDRHLTSVNLTSPLFSHMH